jgi:molybdopterin-guanine dinucleotide biosynthesis protein A
MARLPSTLGAILAGGLSRRMGGGDKALLTVTGRTLLAHVLDRLAPQCECVILNANGDPSRFGRPGLPVVADSVPGCLGPLAGILTSLEWAAAHRPEAEWVVSVPGDTPFIPTDLVRRLHEARLEAQRPLACASSGLRVHFAVGLWPVALRHDLRQALVGQGTRSIKEWAGPHGYAAASWPDEPVDPFLNINTPEDLDRASAQAPRERCS